MPTRLCPGCLALAPLQSHPPQIGPFFVRLCRVHKTGLKGGIFVWDQNSKGPIAGPRRTSCDFTCEERPDLVVAGPRGPLRPVDPCGATGQLAQSTGQLARAKSVPPVRRHGSTGRAGRGRGFGGRLRIYRLPTWSPIFSPHGSTSPRTGQLAEPRRGPGRSTSPHTRLGGPRGREVN